MSRPRATPTGAARFERAHDDVARTHVRAITLTGCAGLGFLRVQRGKVRELDAVFHGWETSKQRDQAQLI